VGVSAIVVPIRVPAAIDRVRRHEVEVARLGVPAHVTILSPFLDSSLLDAAVHARVRELIGRVPAFDARFGAVRRWPPSAVGPGVVWLEPRPSGPFVALTRAIWAAFPECPPYGQSGDDLVPHLTVAIDEPDHFDLVESTVSPLLPFGGRVDHASLLVQGASGYWRTAARFALA
jgi:2'-5' RNA ligase superfamily protein